MTYGVGVDVGGTKCAVTLVDETGSSLGRSWAEHTDGLGIGLTDIVLAATRELLATHGLVPDDVGVFGVAVAGLVSQDRSTFVRGPTLGAEHLDLGSRLSTRLGRPVVVVNDANAALYGHVRLSAQTRGGPSRARSGDEWDVWLSLALGTGIGGAIMVGDRIVVGESGYAAELGHVAVDYTDRRTCLCGSSGCLEQFASGRGIAELAASSPPPPTSQARLAAMGERGPCSARAVVALAGSGDPWAVGLLAQGGTMLGRAIATLCVTLDPGIVIIAGGFGHAASEWLLPHAETEMRSRWPYALERPLPPLRLDAIGPYAAATGAALMAMMDLDTARASDE